MAKLSIVGTPIGNLEDMTLRGLKVIFSYEVIIAEDTRNFIKLRNLLSERYPDIIRSLNLNLENKPILISYRDQNHQQVVKNIIEIIEQGKSIALISDAGMPTISDPGYRLIKEVLEKGIEVEVIPGPTAVESALSISGLPTDKFTFLGFLPRERSKILKSIEANKENTLIFYESPFRVIKTLEIIAEKYPETQVAAANDLTKKFEKVVRGNIKDALQILKTSKVQGEWTICLKVNY
jgi:16S rRNA (cytidine1402-2'-O)-methyltransferase